ncbi:MAG: hypothetical protein ACUVWP_09205 [bacterium]
MSFFFIKRKVDPEPYLDEARLQNIEFNTAVCLRDLEEAVYILPRLMENLLKWTVAIKGGLPLKGIHLEVHLPFLTDKIVDSEDIDRRREVINKAFVLYDEISKHRFYYLSDKRQSVDILYLLDIYKSFINCLEVYHGKKIF